MNRLFITLNSIMIFLSVILGVSLGLSLESFLIGVFLALPFVVALYSMRAAKANIKKVGFVLNILYFGLIFLGSLVMCSGGSDPAGKSSQSGFMAIFVILSLPYLFNFWYIRKNA